MILVSYEIMRGVPTMKRPKHVANSWSSRRPFFAWQIGLFRYGSRRSLVLLRRVVVVAESPFHHGTQLCSNAFFDSPINGEILPNYSDKFNRCCFERFIP
jgi:hypothetical protein